MPYLQDFQYFFIQNQELVELTPGGGVDQVLNRRDYSVVGKDLSLRTPGISGVIFQKGENYKNLKILQEEPSDSFNNSQIGLTLLDSPTNSWSKTINQEIQKEQDISKVSTDQKRLYDNEAKKIENILTNFQSAKNKVQKYLEKKKGGGGDSETSSLSPEERKALLSVFEGFYNLDQKKSALSSKLSTAGGENLESLASNLEEGLKKEVKQALKKINWKEKEVKLIKRLGDAPSTANNLFGWKKWEQSPFNKFYDTQGEWLESMKQWEHSLSAHKKKIQRDKLVCSFSSIGFGGKRSSIVNSCVRQDPEYRENFQKSKDIVEMHIAKWLLKKMGQLPQEQIKK